jgi:hypothetical protein
MHLAFSVSQAAFLSVNQVEGRILGTAQQNLLLSEWQHVQGACKGWDAETATCVLSIGWINMRHWKVGSVGHMNMRHQSGA